MVLQNIPDILQDLVHVLVVVILESLHCLLRLTLFQVVHFELVVVQQLQVIVNLGITFLSRFDELVVTLPVVICGAVGVVEGVGQFGHVVDVCTLDSGFEVVSH